MEEQVDAGDKGEPDSNSPEGLTFEFFGEESMSESEPCAEEEVAVEEEEGVLETEEPPAVVQGLRKSTGITAGKH